MIALVWMLTWLPQVLPAMSKLPPPVNVNLTSDHFHHMLRWEPGPGTPTGVYYHVAVIRDKGTSWVPVAGCEHVQHPLVCNLTEAVNNAYYAYFIRITPLLESRPSEPYDTNPAFKPIRDTHLDLPLLTVTPCGKNLCVELQPRIEHLRKIYESLRYSLRIKCKGNGVDREKDIQESREIFDNLAPGIQCCVAVCFKESEWRRQSNYSQPVCAFTTAIYNQDPLISGVLCSLVITGLVVLTVLGLTGFIHCLIKNPLPNVLASIRHLNEVLVVESFNESLSSLLNLKPTPPPSGEKRSNHSSDESDEESETESTGGEYKLRVGTNLLSSSSSSSASLSAPLPPEPEPKPSSSSDQTSDSVDPQPDSLPGPEQRASDPPAERSTAPAIQLNKEEQEEEVVVVVEGSSQDVNLLTLTFGTHEEEEEKLHLVSPSVSEVYTTPILPAQTRDSKEGAVETVCCSVDEEEEEEEEDYSGYMGRPSTHVLRNLLHNTVHGGKMGLWMLLLLLLHLHLGNAPWIECGEEVEGLNVVCDSLPAPSNVSISSFNMEHTLSFLPGPGTPSSARFSVEVLSFRKNSWKQVASCSALTAGQTCNLTRTFKDPLKSYRARVRAIALNQTSYWTMSRDFYPLTDTVLGPPDVSVSGCGNCLLLQLKIPTRFTEQLQILYRELVLHVQRTRDGVQFRLNVQYEEEIVIAYLQPGMEYCVRVSVKTFFGSNSVSSKPYCAFTSPPSHSSSLYVVYCLLGAFSVLGCFLIGFVVYGSRLSSKLLRRLPRTLSYFLLQVLNCGRAPPECLGQISATQLHKEGSADCLLTAHRPLELQRSNSEECEEDCGLPVKSKV
ncbi:cytokine receptor family member b2 [Morone saxatilis]|uniref:cytokine receptor family member b2 n=1 Tax=Morone saxatilis TaxID=34816 RepID=UPI0015E24DA7|nr:cytokine receptor family member b2 [Morone saxatilis]